MPFTRRKLNGKRAYVAKKRAQKRESKSSTAKDMGQDFQIKKLTKAVKGLTASTKGWVVRSSANNDYAPIVSILNVSSATPMLNFSVTGGTLLNGLSGGLGQTDRQGDYVTMRRFVCRYHVRQALASPTTANGLTCTVRVMVVLFRRMGGDPATASGSDIPTFADIFANQSMTMARGYINNLGNPEQRQNYHVYYDKLHRLETPLLPANTSIGGNHVSESGHFIVIPKGKDRIVTYNNNTAQYTDIQYNAVAMLAFSDNATLADANPPELSMQCLYEYSQ